MELWEIELGVRKFFEFCEKHKELCPHEWKWDWRSGVRNSREEDEVYGIGLGERVRDVWYRCEICGMRKRKVERVGE